MSLPLTVASARREQRGLLMAILAVFIVCHILAACSVNFGLIVVARVGIALCHSIFWSIIPSLATWLAPPDKKHRLSAKVR